MVLMGLSNGLLPYSPSLPVLYLVSFVGGMASGSLDTGGDWLLILHLVFLSFWLLFLPSGNILLLHIWSGRDSGPYMHALHFTFGIGAFLAPLISRPFLVNFEEVVGNQTLEVESGYEVGPVEVPPPLLASSSILAKTQEEQSIWSIKALYPMVAAYALLLSFGFLFYHFRDREAAKNAIKEEKKKEENKLGKTHVILVVSSLSVLFFLYVGMEVAFGTFVSVFAVQSKLQLTRKQVHSFIDQYFSPIAGF